MNPVAALVVFLAGFGLAWTWQADRADARVQTLTASHSQAEAGAARRAAQTLSDAQARADQIDRAAEIRTATLEKQLQETQRALKTATRNRPCLGGPALRLLGQSPGIQLGAADRAPAGPLHGGPGGTAADPADEGEHATDTDIADWIAVAGARYEKCRGQLADIREWEEGGRP